MANQARKAPATTSRARPGARRKLRWDEKGRLTAMGCVCGALLLVALLLPLAFRRPAETGKTPENAAARSSAGEKAALFITYWYGDGENRDLTVERSDPSDAASTAFCEETMAVLTARCIDDRALTGLAPTGSEYTTVTDRNGTLLKLCRMWLQAQGDWQNWLDVCFDAENGTIYYLYLSRECLTNLSLYTGAARPAAAEIAEQLAGTAGGTLRYFSEGGAGGTAVVDAEGGTLCYQISQTNYDALIDLRINCV